MEKGQCPTITTWEGVNIRPRKSTPTATTPGQVHFYDDEIFLIKISKHFLTGITPREWWCD